MVQEEPDEGNHFEDFEVVRRGGTGSYGRAVAVRPRVENERKTDVAKWVAFGSPEERGNKSTHDPGLEMLARSEGGQLTF